MNICLDYGVIAPTFELIHKGMKVVLFKEKLKKVGEELTKNQLKILKYITINSKITAKELSKKVGISDRKIEENIRKMKLINIIQRIGSARSGHWKIIKTKNI